MAVKRLSTVVGPRGLPELAPDLTFFTGKTGGSVTYVVVSNIDATGSLTTILSLTGKFAIDILVLTALTSNDIDQIKLTVDGIVIWDQDGLSDNDGTEVLLGQTDGDNGMQYRCETSFLLQLETKVDTSTTLSYLARPIL